MKVLTYLIFNGRCQEALDFYQQAVGAEILFRMHYSESPEPCGPLPAGFESKIMHCSFRIGETDLMAADGNSDEPAKFDGFSLPIICQTAEQAERAFQALGEGGQTLMPLTETFFAPKFGMLADRFGVNWMVLVENPQQGC